MTRTMRRLSGSSASRRMNHSKELPEPIAQLLQALAKSHFLELYAGKLDASNFLFEGLIARLKGIPV